MFNIKPLLIFFNILFVCFILLPNTLNAQNLGVNVTEILTAEAINVNYDSIVEDGKVFKTSFELFNSGSIGYKARVRLDVFNDKNLVYTGWSDEKSLPPGIRVFFRVYWYPSNSTGNFTGRLMIYYANEIEKMDTIEFEVKGISIPEKSIEIVDFKTYDEEVEIALKSDQSLNNVVVIPSGYPLGWVFEQTMIEKLEKNKVKRIGLVYKPSLWKPTLIKLDVITEDGKYYTSESFLLERETGIRRLLYYSLKWIRNLF